MKFCTVQRPGFYAVKLYIHFFLINPNVCITKTVHLCKRFWMTSKQRFISLILSQRAEQLASIILT
uniref:Uncharacterized protein n=1 Tax=Anguilla anguilla TaxID=7936 RepID=A0A0E9UD54_ANGAN